jgi:hypothetical protein
LTQFEFHRHWRRLTDNSTRNIRPRARGDVGAKAGRQSHQPQSQSREPQQPPQQQSQQQQPPELFTVVCLSGWLRDYRDFFRPWGAPLPSFMSNTDKNEDGPQQTESSCGDDSVVVDMDYDARLVQFYPQHRPDHLSRVNNLLQQRKGEEDQLDLLLEAKYGVNPCLIAVAVDTKNTKNTTITIINTNHKIRMKKVKSMAHTTHWN